MAGHWDYPPRHMPTPAQTDTMLTVPQDGSGTISTKELLGVMRSMGQNPTEDELLALVMEVDINGDGTIDFQEFLGMMKSKANEADQESDLREAFKIFDRDKDGYIDMKELKKVACMLGATLTKDEVDEFMREADVVSEPHLIQDF